MNRFRGVEHLETVFIEKLSEKFKLNERDLKKAFIRFDTNKNGLLDMDELRAAVKAFVNGAPDDQVDELMQVIHVNYLEMQFKIL
jgi:Ca2+-binding EF-hand superfamily protein